MEEEVECEHLLEILDANSTLFKLVVGALHCFLLDLALQLFTLHGYSEHYLSHIIDIHSIKAHTFLAIDVLLECWLVHFELAARVINTRFLLGLALLQGQIIVKVADSG